MIILYLLTFVSGKRVTIHSFRDDINRKPANISTGNIIKVGRCPDPRFVYVKGRCRRIVY